MDFLDRFLVHVKSLRRKRRELAHQRFGQCKSGEELPEERAWMDQLFGAAGFVDAFRVLNKEADQYTWWSNRGQARAKNVGWRLDYQVVSPTLESCVEKAEIYTAERFSDHAPLIMDYDRDW